MRSTARTERYQVISYEGPQGCHSTVGMSTPVHGNDLRPKDLSEFVGLGAQLKSLKTLLTAASIREDPVCGHILLSGPPGCGKTSLAYVIASELNTRLVVLSGPTLEKPGDIAAALSSSGKEPAVVFIDEIHAIPTKAEETLYVPMEDGVLDIVIGDERESRSLRLALGPFCLIGATTAPGKLSAPLRSRFEFDLRVDLYSTEELATIALNTSKRLEFPLSDDGAALLAGRSRGTPRVANNLVRRARDWFDVNKSSDDTEMSEDMVGLAMEEIGIDSLGLDHTGRSILAAICEKFDGGPVGINSLASVTGESQNTIEVVYEPHLLREGLVKRTGRGRRATAKAWSHLGLSMPGDVKVHSILNPDDDPFS